MSAISDNLPTLSPPPAPTTDGTPHIPMQVISNSPSAPDLENQNHIPPQPRIDRPRSNLGTRVTNTCFLPLNMWAPLPDYYLEQRLTSHPDEFIHHDLYKVLLGAQSLRTQQWRYAYWAVTISFVCTIGTAFIGIATAILSFDNHPLAPKILSILVAAFGVVLSLLKGSGLPANAFANVNRSNHIIDIIGDFPLSSTIDIKRLDEIKATWRAVRDNSVTERGDIWKNIQK